MRVVICLLAVVVITACSKQDYKDHAQERYNKQDALHEMNHKKTTNLENNHSESILRKTLPMQHDGHDVELTFEYKIEKGEPVILPKPPSEKKQYQVTPIPNSDKSIIEFEGSLYSLDLKNGKIEILLNDEYKGQTFSEMKKGLIQESNNPNAFVWWGTRPSVSPDGSHLIFNTNRRQGEEQVWFKDLTTGEERPITSLSTINVIGWVSNQEFIGESFSEIFHVNVKNDSILSYGQATSIGVSHSYVVIQQELGSIQIIDLDKETNHTFVDDQLNRVSHMTLYEHSPWIALVNMPDERTPLYELLVINLEELKIKRFDINKKQIPIVLKWLDSDTLLLTVKDERTEKEEKIKVDIKSK
ncbi:TolB family protein [Bacillaceae bacterium W0354]